MTHCFDVGIATIYGVNAAILLQNIAFWIEHNEANEINFHDGYYWTFNSLDAFHKMFPYIKRDAINRALHKLEDDGIILRGNYNTNKMKRTTWYAITEKGRALLYGNQNVARPDVENATTISRRQDVVKRDTMMLRNATRSNNNNNNIYNIYTDNKQTDIKHICSAGLNETAPDEDSDVETEPETAASTESVETNTDALERTDDPGQVREAGTDTETETEENGSSVKKKYTLKESFELCWKRYCQLNPKKHGKAAAFERYKQWLSKTGRMTPYGKRCRLTEAQIWDAIVAYERSVMPQNDEEERKRPDWQNYVKNFDTFLNKAILDYVEVEL